MNETATYVSLEDVVQFTIGRTLADEAVDGQHVVVDIVIARIAHEYDLHVLDIVVQAVDVMTCDDDFTHTWSVDMQWSVQCDECSRDVEIGETTKFSQPLCRTHLDEAYEQDLADQHNDDVALGLA